MQSFRTFRILGIYFPHSVIKYLRFQEYYRNVEIQHKLHQNEM